MGLLTTRLKLQLCSVVCQAPRHQVQNVLRELAAGPLIAVDDGEIQGDDAQSLAGYAVTVDALVALAGPGQDAFSFSQHAGYILRLRLQDVFERPFRSGHCYLQVCDGGSGSGCWVR